MVSSAVAASSTPMSFTVDVPPGKWKSVHLKNLPKDIVVAVAMTSNGAITVGFLDAPDHKQFPTMSRPLFWGQAESKLGFSVTIQQNGDYYVVLDNRNAATPKKVTITARASLSKEAAKAIQEERVRQVERQLKKLEQRLNQAFIFEPVPISVKQCGKPAAFVRSDGLTLCLEYVRALLTALSDKAQASDALAYSLFYEMAQLLENKWKLDHASPSRPHSLDELTTVLMLTFRLDTQVRSYAQTLISRSDVAAQLASSFPDSAHLLDPSRAQRVLDLANDPALLQNWQPILVPRMQTAMLKHLKQHPQHWTNEDLLDRELETRPEIPKRVPSVPPSSNKKTLTF